MDTSYVLHATMQSCVVFLAIRNVIYIRIHKGRGAYTSYVVFSIIIHGLINCCSLQVYIDRVPLVEAAEHSLTISTTVIFGIVTLVGYIFYHTRQANRQG